jgi:hypothetical protein
LALYYFVDGEPPREGRKSTTYRPRPQDSALHAMLIRLDNRCISLYSWLKTKLRISDGWASRFLGFFFDRRK